MTFSGDNFRKSLTNWAWCGALSTLMWVGLSCPASAQGQSESGDIIVNFLPSASLSQAYGEPGSVSTASWSTVSQAGFFSARFPGTTKKSSDVTKGVESTSWEAETSDPLHLFKLTMVQFGSGAIPAQDVDNFLFAAIQSRSRELGAPATQKRRIENPRSPGCTFKVLTDQADWSFMVRLDGTNVYTLSVCSMSGESDDGYSDTFFKSLNIGQ